MVASMRLVTLIRSLVVVRGLGLQLFALPSLCGVRRRTLRRK